jgi:hypothetical protein
MRAKALRINANILDIPIDINDIIEVCTEFNKLGKDLQNQTKSLFELGVEESIKNGSVKINSLPLIKSFLIQIGDNFYFGDASDQAYGFIFLIDKYLLDTQYSSLN